MTPYRLILPAAPATNIAAAAEASYPAECCGLLVGDGDGIITVREVVAAANIADTPRTRFLIDPQIQFDVLRRLRSGPLRIVGHYHSHTNGLATLSQHDRAMADDPEAIWLVVAVSSDGRALPPRAFVCPRDGSPVSVAIADGA
jgi:proteasome lid subunit RPN8/RPN11